MAVGTVVVVVVVVVTVVPDDSEVCCRQSGATDLFCRLRSLTTCCRQVRFLSDQPCSREAGVLIRYLNNGGAIS